MQKDTRANVIFLTIFLAITLPGAVILFKKKLDPAVPAMSLPPQPRTQIPYLSPMDATDLKRYVPDKTGQWVATLAASHNLTPLKDNGLPPMSPHRTVQRLSPTTLLIWSDDASGQEDLSLPNTPITHYESLQIPDDVRKELIYAGFSQPPKHAAWVEFSPSPDHPPTEINIANHPESLPPLARH